MSVIKLKNNKEIKDRITVDLKKLTNRIYFKDVKIKCLSGEDSSGYEFSSKILFTINGILFEILSEYAYNKAHYHTGCHDMLIIDNKVVYDLLYEKDDNEEKIIDIINQDVNDIIHNAFIKLNYKDLKYSEFKLWINDFISII